jgi:hypothetical protein
MRATFPGRKNEINLMVTFVMDQGSRMDAALKIMKVFITIARSCFPPS